MTLISDDLRLDLLTFSPDDPTGDRTTDLNQIIQGSNRPLSTGSSRYIREEMGTLISALERIGGTSEYIDRPTRGRPYYRISFGDGSTILLQIGTHYED